MKKSLLILSLSLLFVAAKSFAQTLPNTLWSDEATTEWYSEDEDVFTITTAEEFAGLATLVNSGNSFDGLTINITNDIDLGEHLWTPIGNADLHFSGTFDGGEHIISNLFIDMPTEDFLGLFGYCSNATLSNIMLSETYVRAFFNSGSLVGNFSEGNMVNCHATGVDVVSTDSNIGGLVGGLVTSSTMLRCSSQGVVKGLSQVGGLVGTPWNLTEISESYSAGTVTAGHVAGGLIGTSGFAIFPNTENIISNCYSRSDVSVLNGRAGGLVGGSDGTIYIYNSYSTGTATGPEITGGFVGHFGNVITGSDYWDVETSEHEEAIGAWASGEPGEFDITGMTTAEMKTSEMVDLLNQDQSVSPWTINPEINDGYPSFTGITVSAPTIQLSNVEVSVYPNIVDAHIQIEAIANLKSYSIYDVSGKIITQGTLMGNASQIDAQNLASGAYILLIDTDQGSATQKFMKK